jgi:hypothetical protein
MTQILALTLFIAIFVVLIFTKVILKNVKSQGKKEVRLLLS